MIPELNQPLIDRRLYPFVDRYMQVGQHRMHYVDEGVGHPLVFVHGNPTWSFHFREPIREFRTKYRCIAPDHIGCGLSDKPQDDTYNYTLRQRVDDLTTLLAKIVPDGPVTLVLHDWGGMIGMTWAVENSDRVARIVLLNTSAFPLPATKPLPWQLKLARTPPLGGWLIRGFNAFAKGTADLGTKRTPMSAEVRENYIAPYRNWNDRIATLRFVEDIPLSSSERAWNVVEKTAGSLPAFTDRPAMICWGDLDPVFDKHFLAEWRRHWPHAEVHQFADCGHYLLDDAPVEVIEHMRNFFASTSRVETQ